MTAADRARDAEHPVGPLPAAVRQRVLAVAAEVLGDLPLAEVPTTLRPFARFAPGKRARLAAGPLAAALERDTAFRDHVAGRWRDRAGELAAALEAGTPPPAADPVDVAAAAYLLRPQGWPDMVTEAAMTLATGERAVEAERAGETVRRLQDQLSAGRAAAHEEVARRRAQTDEAHRVAESLRRELKQAREEARRAEQDTRRARADAADAQTSSGAAIAALEAELRRVRNRLAEVETALEAARRVARDERSVGDTRRRLLLDTLVEAAQGLRRELALPPLSSRPADGVEAVLPERPGPSDVAERALAADDPALLDQLLDLPQVHLVVDGYNVTKSGYGELPLEAQRNRLVTGLAALAARCRAEVTCVFDGADLAVPVTMATPRGVRVLFSPPGQSADELVRRLVRAEPPGRPVLVVSSDREVADGVRRAGARPLPATLLLRRLERV